MPHASESLRYLKDAKNIPELIIPETGEAFVRELDNIALSVNSGRAKGQFSFVSVLPDEFYEKKLSRDMAN